MSIVTSHIPLKIKVLDKAEIEGVEAYLYFNMEDISPDGVFLTLESASAERGEKLFSKIVEKVSLFVNGFKKTSTINQ